MYLHCIIFLLLLIKGLRAQIDRDLYRQYMQEEISRTSNLTIMESSVDDLIINNDHKGHTVKGVYLCKYIKS